MLGICVLIAAFAHTNSARIDLLTCACDGDYRLPAQRLLGVPLDENLCKTLKCKNLNLSLLLLLLALTQAVVAQTFRGGIAGIVQDGPAQLWGTQKISLTGTDTGLRRETVSTGTGTYSLEDLPLGNYSIVVEAAGFNSTKIDKIAVHPGQSIRSRSSCPSGSM